MEKSFFNGPFQTKENPNLLIQSFSSTFQSSASPSLFQDISNRNFSLNEILPSPPSSKLSHRRFNSQALDLLNPRYLFSSKHSIFPPSRNSENLKKTKSLKKNIVMHDCDEFNTTRSLSSAMKTGMDSEIGRLTGRLPQIFVSVSQNMRFCRKCDKIVEIREEFQDGDGEGKVFQFICVFVACWEPKWVQQFKVEKCVECGNVVL